MSTVKTIWIAALISLLFWSCKTNEGAVDYDLAITSVTVITETGAVLENHSVYIGGDTIASVLAPRQQVNPKAKKYIDGSGKFLMPGLWDNHVHFRGGADLIAQNEAFLEQYIQYGITTVRDAGGDLTTQVQQWNAEIQSGDRIGPTMYTSGPKLDGADARWAGSLPVTSDESLTSALDSLQSLDVDYVKLYDSTLSRKRYLDIIAQAESRGMITSGHMPFTVELQEAIDAGLDNIEHLYYVLKGCSNQEKEITQSIRDGRLGFWGSMEQLIATYDEERAQQTFASLKQNDVFVTPTLHIGDVLSYLDEVDHSHDAYLSHLSDTYIKTYEGRNNSARNASEAARENRKELQRFFITLAAALQEAGVQLLSGSDCGAYNSYIYPGPSLHKELEQMVLAGLTPAQALQTSFYHGPKFLKKDGYGLRKGAKADLVLLNASPLEDIKNTQEIDMVIKSGKVINL